MKDYTKKEFQRMSPEEVRKDVPFSLSTDGEKYAIVIDYAKYEIFTRIKEVVEATVEKEGGDNNAQ